MIRRRAARLTAALVVVAGGAVAGADAAGAHPLGNFSVNHLNQLRFERDRVVNDAIVDIAEIPTAQAADGVDADGDGAASEDELDRYGAARCDALSLAQTLVVDGVALAFAVDQSSFGYEPGAAGLAVSRLECRLEAPADLSVARTVEFADDFEADRVGWHEITAVGVGARLVASPVPTQSVTEGLRSYPIDLLDSPEDVRRASFTTEPGANVDGAATPQSRAPVDRRSTGIVERIDDAFTRLVSRDDLTLGVGLLAVGLALVLGASHALLPGHGKTVMAAYVAGRQGSVRDAVVVGATVTGTHTGGVLVLGLALTLSTSLAGESVLGWLGVSSGVLVAALGASLLAGLLRHRGRAAGRFHHGHQHGSPGHHHGRDEQTGDALRRLLPTDGEHEHDHDHDHSHGQSDHRHPHEHHHADGRVEGAQPSAVATLAGTGTVVGGGDRGRHGSRPSRRSLIGIGVAGGLVPSPSALVILLSAIALGRTAFGVLLVVGYGLGMAATLTAAGVLLVKVRDRYQPRGPANRISSVARRWGAIAPYATALLVLVVGLGLIARNLSLT